MAEKQSIDSMEDILKCPVCLVTYTELKTLPCHHSFCQHCLKDWLEKKGVLECPNCRQVHSLFQSELQELPSTLKVIEKQEGVPKPSVPKCFCGECDAAFYCQDCSQYLCKACEKSHEMFPALKNHQLQELDSLEELLCPEHEKEFDYFCNTCKILICAKCKDTDHQDDDGEHEPIKVADAFEEFQETATALMRRTNIYTKELQRKIKKCTANVSKLSADKISLKADINNTVEEIIELVRETGKALEEKLDEVCDLKIETNYLHIDELKVMTSTVNEKQDAIAKSRKCDAAKALQSGQEAVGELQEILDVVPEAGPEGDGQIYYTVKNDHVLKAIREHGIGIVSEKPIANFFEILTSSPLKLATSQKSCKIKISQNVKCKVDMGLLDATFRNNPIYSYRRKINNDCKVNVEQIKEGEYYVKCFFENNPTGTSLDIKFAGASIKGSPLTVAYRNKGLEKKFQDFLEITDIMYINNVLVSKTGYFIVADEYGHTGKFKSSSGAYITNVKMNNSRYCRICELINNDLVFCESDNKKITFCNPSGQIYKSISTGKNNLLGFTVNESLNLVYVAESGCVNVFDMTSGDKVKTIGTKGNCEGQMKDPSGVAVTKDGNIIVADTGNSRVQLFDKEGMFQCILICGGNDDGLVIKPSQVIVDNDENIIIASQDKVQLFDSSGEFIHVIHQEERKNISKNDFRSRVPVGEQYAISIFSYNPRSVAVAKLNSKELSIMNY